MPVKIDPMKLRGPWEDGYVLERQHTLSSEFLGHDSFGNPQFDTKRSELGELVFRLKNRNDKNTLDPIAETAVQFIEGWNPSLDLIVPVPPSRKRAYQPVIEIAQAIGAHARHDEDTDANMTKVFIAGSRQLSRLNADVKRRIDTMIEKGFTILVGDANGADKAVQRYLAEQRYRNVIVHCMADNCRNNVGDWPTREITAPKGARGFAYYATKDQAMVDDAAYGLMLWDGESKGTLNSVINMIRQDKPVVVYLAPMKTFLNLRSTSDVVHLLTNCDRESMQRFERELGIERALQHLPLP